MKGALLDSSRNSAARKFGNFCPAICRNLPAGSVVTALELWAYLRMGIVQSFSIFWITKGVVLVFFQAPLLDHNNFKNPRQIAKSRSARHSQNTRVSADQGRTIYCNRTDAGVAVPASCSKTQGRRWPLLTVQKGTNKPLEAY